MRGGQIERCAITGREQLVLSVLPAIPDRADGVDHMLGRQAIAAGDLGGAGIAAAQSPALGQQLRPGGAVNRAVDAAATEQASVGGVDDCVHVKRRDVDD